MESILSRERSSTATESLDLWSRCTWKWKLLADFTSNTRASFVRSFPKSSRALRAYRKALYSSKPVIQNKDMRLSQLSVNMINNLGLRANAYLMGSRSVFDEEEDIRYGDPAECLTPGFICNWWVYMRNELNGTLRMIEDTRRNIEVLKPIGTASKNSQRNEGSEN